MSQPDELRKIHAVLDDTVTSGPTGTMRAIRLLANAGFVIVPADRIERLEAQQAAVLDLHHRHAAGGCSCCVHEQYPCRTRRAARGES